MDELEALRKENAELKKTIESLRKQLQAQTLKSFHAFQAEKKRWNDDQDYLPYQDREDRQSSYE